MKIGWVSGWAVPERWFAALAEAAFPGAVHVVVAASPSALEELEAAGPFDLIVGYSLGSLLLMQEFANPRKGVRLCLLRSSDGAQHCRIAILAPVFAFSREAGLGGRVSRAELRLLARRLRIAPDEALAGFYARAGLSLPSGPASEFSPATLAWGLEQLEQVAVPASLPPKWRAYCGAADALLDAACLHALDSGIVIVPQATHDPAALIRALALAP